MDYVAHGSLCSLSLYYVQLQLANDVEQEKIFNFVLNFSSALSAQDHLWYFKNCGNQFKMPFPSINCWTVWLVAGLFGAAVSQTQYKRLEYKYSFKGPYIVLKDNSVPFWDVGGREWLLFLKDFPCEFGVQFEVCCFTDAIASDDQIRLAPSLKARKGIGRKLSQFILRIFFLIVFQFFFRLYVVEKSRLIRLVGSGDEHACLGKRTCRCWWIGRPMSSIDWLIDLLLAVVLPIRSIDWLIDWLISQQGFVSRSLFF